MAFKPRHELPVTGPDGGDWPNVMQAPIQLRKTVDASQNWLDATKDPGQAADQIVDFYSASIANFVAVNRRNIAAGSVNITSRFQNFPGLTLQYENQFGKERLSMTAYPESFVGGRTIGGGSEFEIDTVFAGFPIPGWQNSTPPGFGSGQSFGGNYYYDGQFVPQAPGYATPDSADLAAGAELWEWIAGYTPFWVISNGTQIDTYPALSVRHSAGFLPPWWNKNMAGSGICINALSGLQYWEVEIKVLPDAVPASKTVQAPAPTFTPAPITLVFPEDENFYQDPSFLETRTLKAVFSWPSDLNTWLTPVIGLVPKEFVDPAWRKNTVAYGGVIGLDPDVVPAARSIGCVRTSSASWTSETRVSHLDGVTLPSPWFSAHGAQQTGPDTNWPGNCLVLVDGQYVARCQASGGVGPCGGPTAAQCATWVGDWATPMSGLSPVPDWPPPMIVGTLQFDILGNISGGGTFYGTSYTFYEPDALDNPFPGENSWTYTPAGSSPWPVHGSTYIPASDVTTPRTLPGGDLFFNAEDAFDGDANLIVSSGLNSPGRKCPVFKGRADALLSVFTPSQDNPIAAAGNNGVWTGVDLGDLKVKDVIMIATDTSTRKVWFGKNGKWYDQSGPTDFSPGSPKLTHTTVMDGDGKTEYFPACSFRMGPLKLTMKLGLGLKYLPPGGFVPYGAFPDVPY